ncbi:hypothetical protein J132_02889 [Termitomyces sp. J132]|nr:hypothetical protein J132_02889 [Termitomyces sp. J132]
MGPTPTQKKSSTTEVKPPSGSEVPSESAPSAAESGGPSVSTAFGQIRDAIPASSIESAVSHVPGGGMATSAFKVAKGFGGLGIALGSAGAAAISKRRRKSKAHSENPGVVAENPVDETEPVVENAAYIQDGKVSTSPASPSILRPNLIHTKNGNILGYGPASTMYYTKRTDQGYIVPGTDSLSELPPIVQYTSVQPYIDENGVEHNDLDFTNNIKGNFVRTDGHMQPSDEYAPMSEIVNTTHQLEPVVHERVHRVEVEEVTRQIIHDRHIHHIQHHTQPVIVREILEEKHHEKVHPSTTVLERHVNNADDLKALDAQVKQHGNTKEYLEPEHFIVDKGSIIKENVHHHIHHIIQPVFEKETMDNHHTHTSIPIKEPVHDLTHDPQFIAGITEKDVPEGKRKSIIPGAQLVRSPSIHCKGCKCHEKNELSESFEKNANISESPVRRQDTGFPGINGESPRKTSISVM